MRFTVKFDYCDKYSNGRWITQEGSFHANSEEEAVEICKNWYGLGVDCEYHILGVKQDD